MARTTKQAGVVSLMVTMVMMIVITLIVLGFAEIVRNQQRNTLDDQLSTQAYYAAESGINDARVAIAAKAAGGFVPSKISCGNDSNYTFNGTVSATYDVAYTCLLINASPTSLSNDIGYHSTVIPVISGSGAAFNTLQLQWKVSSGLSATAAGCYTNIASLDTLPVADSIQWACHYPMLRVDMFDANGGVSRANWGNATATMFLVPFNSSSTNNNVTLAARGTMVPAQCNASACTANITGLTGTKYYMRVTSMYSSNSRLTMSAGGLSFIGAQAIIDATGRAGDVIKRVAVAVDLTDANASTNPDGAIISQDSICKRFSAANGSYFDAPLDANMNNASGADGNPLCLQRASPTPPQP